MLHRNSLIVALILGCLTAFVLFNGSVSSNAAEGKRDRSGSLEETVARLNQTVEELRVWSQRVMSDRLPTAPSIPPKVASATPRDPYISPERNDPPLWPRNDAEKNWKHEVYPLPPLSSEATEDMAILHALFEEYRLNYNSTSNIPVYAVPCVNECNMIPNHWRNMAGAGLGHFIVIVNRPAPNETALFRQLADAFPRRFTMLHYPDGGGNAESMNTGLRLGFSIVPTPNFVQIANGDLWVNKGYAPLYARFTHAKAVSHMATQVRGFSHFAITKHGWDVIGIFDEAAYPAEFDDSEYMFRVWLMGGRLADFPVGRPDAEQAGFNPDRFQHEVFTHQHGGSVAGQERRFKTEVVRWARGEYMCRKWGQFPGWTYFRHPFNLTWLPIRHSNFFDPVHRQCIVTGEGPKYLVGQGDPKKQMCRSELCQGCYWNATTAFAPYAQRQGSEAGPASFVTSQDRLWWPSD